MPNEIKIIASVIATGIALVAYLPYLRDMFKGKNKPHLYAWISIFIITAVVAYLQFIGGAGIGAIPTAIGVLIDAIILFYCFRFGTKDIIFMDKICLAISIIGVIAYIVFRSTPSISLAIVLIAEVISFIPTFRKTMNDPYSEYLPTYYMLIVKLTLILIALQQYNFLTAFYSVMWIIVFLIFLPAVYIRRFQVKTAK